VAGGAEAGTFNDETTPTGTQVELLCEKAARAVASKIGVAPCNEELTEDATSAAALYAAMLVEQSYYPEQTRNAGSSFQSLLSLYKDQIKDLASQVAEECGGGPDDPSGSGVLGQAFFDDFPLIGRGTPEAW
jgi:hypothetical protein